MYDFEGFTLEWYKEVFEDTRLLIIVLNTIVIALIVGADFDDHWGDRCNWHSFYVKRRQMRNTLLSLNNV